MKIARSREVDDYLSTRQVSWKFIVKRAPWWGGFYKRLVRSIKRSLKKSIGKSHVTYDQLTTLLIEIESIINSRPLTYLSNDQDRVKGSLCPSHLINGRRLNTAVNEEHFEIVSTHQSLVKRLKHHRHLLNQFLNQWRRDYLLNLRESHKLNANKHGKPLIQIGDVVILKSDTCKLLFWKLGVINQLLTSKDGNVRAAIVRVPDSQGNSKSLRRSVKHLFSIEVRQETVPDGNLAGSSVSSPPSGQSEGLKSGEQAKNLTSDSTVQVTRTRRQASIAGEQQCRKF